MDYVAILKRTWEIVKTRRWLWGLGILAAATEGSGGFNFNGNFAGDALKMSPSPSPSVSPSLIDGAQQAHAASTVSRVLGESVDRKAELIQMFMNAGDWISQHWYIFVIFGLVAIALWLICFYISYAANAGLILSAQAIEDDHKNLGFGKAFHAGRKYAWPLFGLNVLISLLVLVATAVGFLAFVAPLLFGIFNHNVTVIIAAGFWAFIGLIIFIILIVYLNLVRGLAARALVLEDLGITQALARGGKLFRRHKGHTLISWLVSIGVGIVYGFVVMLVLAVIVAVGAILGIGLSTIGTNAAFVTGLSIAGLVGLIIIIGLIILSGAYVSYYSVYWTLIYRALVHLDTHKHAKHT